MILSRLFRLLAQGSLMSTVISISRVVLKITLILFITLSLPVYSSDISKEAIKRAEIARPLLLAKYGPNYSPPVAAFRNVFSDIAINDFAASWIERLEEEGVTEGCALNKFCPEMVVTKSQLAKILLKAKFGQNYVPDDANGIFTDVPTIMFNANWIEALKTEGLSEGCSDTRFCPDEILTQESFNKMLYGVFPSKPVFIIGDSTVHIHTSNYLLNARGMDCGADNPNNEIKGWGDALSLYEATPNNIVNKARAGSSSVTYRTEVVYDADRYGVNRDWPSTKALMEAAGGGTLLIQFGSGNENNHAPVADYDNDGDIDGDDEALRRALRKENFDEAIGNYIAEARAINIIPILVTPPDGRHDWNTPIADGFHPNTRWPFPTYLQDLGVLHGVEVLDLNSKSNTEFAKYSDEILLREFGDCSYFGGTIDRVHYEIHGAKKVAGWVKELACSELTDQTLCSQFSTVEDHIIPTLSLVGDYYIVLAAGEPYADLGATALDDVDGDISNHITTVQSIDSNVAGDYFVTYDVIDLSSNSAIQLTRTVSVGSGVVVREDAEDSDTDGWETYATTQDSTVSNVFDAQRGNRVIELNGNDGLNNGFRYNRVNPWNEMENFIVSWSLNFNQDFTIFIAVDTSDGYKTFEYQPIDNVGEITANGRYRFGLGVNANNGTWQTFTRDLRADLAILDPAQEVLRIHRIAIRGSGRIDDIKTMRSLLSEGNEMPPVVSVIGNSAVEVLTNTVYVDEGATAVDDVDGDITVDIVTTNTVNTNIVGSYLVTYKVHDSTGNGAFSTRTVDVVNAISEEITILEDAEDGDTLGWGTYAGAGVINNVVDNGGHAIELDGPNGLGDGFSFTNLNILDGFVATWSMKYSEPFEFFVKVRTTDFAGNNVYLKYTPDDLTTGYSSQGSSHFVHNGLGAGVTDGTWQTFSRDLKADFNTLFPNDTIEEVIGFYIRGSGRIDDIGISTRGAVATFTYQGHTYEIVKNALSWQDASNAAQVSGGYLANIGSIAENHQVYSRLYRFIQNNEFASTEASNGGGASYVWLGGNDLLAEGSWVWEDTAEQFWSGDKAGNPVGGLFNNWGLNTNELQNEPDDAGNQDANGMALTRWPIGSGSLGQTSQWNDLKVDDLLYYIIEYD